MKRSLMTLAGLALAVFAPSIASAAVYRTSIEAPHRAPIGAWVEAQGQLYRNNRAAGFKHRFDHTYRWAAFSLRDWQAFEARGRQGLPPPPKGQWQKADSKLQMQNFWRTQSPGRYMLTVRTRKTGWVNAGVTRVSIGRARPKRRFVKSIQLPRKHITLQPGQRFAIGATALDQHGKPIQGARLYYALYGGGRLHGHSFVAGHQPGTYKLEVYGPRRRVCAALTIEIVEPLRCAAITFSQSSLSLDCGTSAPISAQAFDQHGRPLATNLHFQVSGGRYHQGQFHAGQSAGRYQLIATHPQTRVRAVLDIEVCEPAQLSFISFKRSVIKVACGQSVNLKLLGFDQFGERYAIDRHGLHWGASGGQIADGNFCANSPGAYLITVTDPSTGLSDRALIVVR